MKSVLAALYHGVKILEKQLFQNEAVYFGSWFREFSPRLASPGPVARQSVTAEGWDRAEPQKEGTAGQDKPYRGSVSLKQAP